MKRDFERFFAGELALSRAWRHLAQACDAQGRTDRFVANVDARFLISKWLAEIAEERRLAIEASTVRVKVWRQKRCA